MSNVDINVDRRTDGRTDGRKIGRLYRTLLQAGAIINNHNFVVVSVLIVKYCHGLDLRPSLPCYSQIWGIPHIPVNHQIYVETK